MWPGHCWVLSALALRYDWLTTGQAWLAEHTSFGSLASSLEDRLVGKRLSAASAGARQPGADPADAVHPPGLPQLPRVGPAPELAGLAPWYNSPPLTLASLRGKVVLVDFWTYSCINCVHTLPHIEDYWTRYQNAPFVLLGIHTPEFVFEKSPQNVAAAIQRHGLTYPIAQDNDYATWNAFGNRYWPAKYLIDGEGIIRYMHFGEGGYEDTDLAIRSLLAELGRRPTGPAVGGDDPSRPRATFHPKPIWVARLAGTGQRTRSSPMLAPVATSRRLCCPASLRPGRNLADAGGERQVLAGAEGAIRYPRAGRRSEPGTGPGIRYPGAHRGGRGGRPRFADHHN